MEPISNHFELSAIVFFRIQLRKSTLFMNKTGKKTRTHTHLLYRNVIFNEEGFIHAFYQLLYAQAYSIIDLILKCNE